MSVVIRSIAAEEFELAGEIVVEAYRTLDDEGDEFYERELRDVAARVESGEVLVAEDDSRVVGCVTFADGPSELSEVDDPDAATIRMLGVSTAARGRGIGELLVRECIERARASGRRRVRLHTRTSMSAAHRLYGRLGFTRAPETDWSPAPGIELLGFVLELDPLMERPRR